MGGRQGRRRGRAGAGKIKANLSSARRALRKKNPDREKALKKLNRALKICREEFAWRKRAKIEPPPGLEGYEMAIRNTIGIRKQLRLPPRNGPRVGLLHGRAQGHLATFLVFPNDETYPCRILRQYVIS